MNKERIKLYQLDKDKETRLWENAIFIFDSSALLDFYGIPQKTRENIYNQTFDRLNERLWIPSHVEFEYLKNRENVILKPIDERYSGLKDKIESVKANFIKTVKKGTEEISRETVNNDRHPHLEQTHINNFQSKIESFEKDLLEFEKNIINQIKLEESEIKNVANVDDVLAALVKYFTVGPEYSFERILEITKEGKHRYEFKIPPGYGDLEKKDKQGTQIFGDFIIWKQILDHSKEINSPIIFITNDIKKDNDWCYIDNRGRVTAPREELIKEIFDNSNVEFWIYNLPQFLFHANDYLKSNIPAETIQTITQFVNTQHNYGDYLKFVCNKCGLSHSIHKSKFKLGFDYVGSDTRNMGPEHHYEDVNFYQCDCGNDITITFELWEYPEGMHNYDSVELDGAKLIDRFYFTKDFHDYDEDYVTCEECDGNKEGLGNMVHNWNTTNLHNEFPIEHENGTFNEISIGSCDWCSTIHVKCPKCNSVTSLPENNVNENTECLGGCGLFYMLESDGHFDEVGDFNIKLIDDRLSECEDCERTFVDKEKNALCPECELKRINN